MKVLCDRQQLTNAFAVVAGIAPSKSPKSIVQNVLVKAERDGLTLLATDLEMSARVKATAVKVDEPGRALLPARETQALLRELTEPTLSLSSRDFGCSIESGGGSFLMLGGDPDEFPPETDVEQGKKLAIRASRLQEMLRRTVFAATKEESRYAVTGVLMDCRQNCLRLVATDARRLALNYENLGEGCDDVRVVLPLGVVNLLLKGLADAGDGMVHVVAGAQQIAFSVDDTLLVGRLLDAKFPEYESVIPKIAETTVEVNRALLETSLRRVAVLTGSDLRQAKFSFSSSTLEMTAENSAVGRADQVIDVDLKGAGGVIALNPDFLLDALRVCDVDTVRIDMTDDSVPVKLTLGETFTYICMSITG
jgi:DNA polymerase-3 subunit beta